jgi:hypothetical protein
MLANKTIVENESEISEEEYDRLSKIDYECTHPSDVEYDDVSFILDLLMDRKISANNLASLLNFKESFITDFINERNREYSEGQHSVQQISIMKKLKEADFLPNEYEYFIRMKGLKVKEITEKQTIFLHERALKRAKISYDDINSFLGFYKGGLSYLKRKYRIDIKETDHNLSTFELEFIKSLNKKDNVLSKSDKLRLIKIADSGKIKKTRLSLLIGKSDTYVSCLISKLNEDDKIKLKDEVVNEKSLEEMSIEELSQIKIRQENELKELENRKERLKLIKAIRENKNKLENLRGITE